MCYLPIKKRVRIKRMRESIRRFHNDVLAFHQTNMFESLVHNFNIVTDSVKSIIFEDEDNNELTPLRGYIALKDQDNRKVKYFIDEDYYDKLPIRVNDCEELYLKESANKKSIILRPLNPTPFRIVPEKCFPSTREFIDSFADFEHTNPDSWTILKIVAIMGYVGKIFVGICSNSETGKSSIFEILHSLTQKTPVFQPRSVPGVLSQITGDGNIVFDEVHESNKETRTCIENFTLQLGGNKPVYINGALRSKYTKSKYDVAQQSITFLYNLKSYYKNPEEQFFDYFFSNNAAINSRILKIKLEGKLLEKFDRNFDMKKTAAENLMYYMKIAKYLLYLKRLKISNGYDRVYDYTFRIGLKGRRRQIYDEITWLIDMYCNDVQEYIKFINLLNKAIISYREMVSQSQLVIEEEVVE